MEDEQKLIGPLAHWLAAGKLEPRIVLPAIQTLLVTESGTGSLFFLHQALSSLPHPALASLKRHLWDVLRKESLQLHDKLRRGQAASEEDKLALQGLSLQVAAEWRIESDPVAPVSQVVRIIRDLAFLAANQEKAPRLFQDVKRQSSVALAAAHAALKPLLEVAPASVRLLLEQQAETPGLVHLARPWSHQVGRARARFVKQFCALFPQSPLSEAGDNPEQRALTENREDAELFAVLQAEFRSAERVRQENILDLVCSWPSPAAGPVLQQMATEPWAQDRAALNLILRFGRPELVSWSDWSGWLAAQCRLWDERLDSLHELIQSQPQALFLILYSQMTDPDPVALDALVKSVAATLPPINPQTLIQTWLKSVSVPEQRALLGLPEPRPPPIPPLIARPIPPLAPPPLPVQAEPELEPAAPPVPPRPSFWEDHLQPLFVENWYIVAGIVMVILGSSLLAYYTWDKHWLIRYTIMPALLAVFTWSLAGLGTWIEKKGAEFKSTAAILRGAAVGLLPINFMAMALLSADEKVPQKGIALLVMAAIYLSVFGWSLRSWCAAVEASLGNLLGFTLLFLNSLVAVGPLAHTVGHLEGRPLLICLGAGFYLGFVATAAVVVRFSRSILTREMAEEKRVPGFLASALAITYLQVFVWVHSFMRHLPHAHTYSLLVIGIGWLILFSERRALELRESPQLHGGESFLGFAFILLGLLMSFGDPTMRILSFVAAGIVWMYQALSRRHPLHYWIALTLLGLGGASVGLLKDFPGVWLPAIGIVLAVGYGLGGWFSREQQASSPQPSPPKEEREISSQPYQASKRGELSEACFGMQVVALVVTIMVAPLSQWHYHSEPLATAAWLLIVAALFAWRSIKDQKLRWLHVTMLVLALALPYAGFMDVTHRSAHHNTMPFGLAVLSFLWLALTKNSKLQAKRASSPQPSPPGEERGIAAAGRRDAGAPRGRLILEARSTVLCFYGVLALAAMLLRVALGDTAAAPLWYRDYMDYAGPILIMLALVPATYYSRSLLPAVMAVAIMAVLFPELRANLQESFPWLSWGSGLFSSIFGLLLVWVAFFLRQWSFLRNLANGDRFMAGESFPLRRHDHTLFTWPVLAAALFLIIKVDTWNLLANLFAHGVHLKTSIALIITGVAWTFAAIYYRDHRSAVVGVHLGWLCALGGIHFAYWQEAANPHWTWPFLITGCLLQVLYWIYRYGIDRTLKRGHQTARLGVRALACLPQRPWVRTLLTEPMRMVLLAGSGGLAVVCIYCVLGGAELQPMRWLYTFVAVQLVWHALRVRHWVFGAILFFQLWVALLDVSALGAGALWERVSVANSLTPTIWLFIAVQIVFVLLEGTAKINLRGVWSGSASGASRDGRAFPPHPGPLPQGEGELQPVHPQFRRSGPFAESGHKPPLPEGEGRGEGEIAEETHDRTEIQKTASLYQFVSPLVMPAFCIASVLTFFVGLGGLLDGLVLHSVSQFQQTLLIIALLLTARAQVSVLFLLVAMLLGYVVIHRGLLTALKDFDTLTRGLLYTKVIHSSPLTAPSDPEDVLKLLAEPWRLSSFGLAMVLVMRAIYWLRGRVPLLVTGPFALPFFRARSRGIVFWPAALFAATAALYHTFDPSLRQSSPQLCAPYIGAVTFALIAWFWNGSRFFAGSGFLLLLGNIHLVRVFAGDFLRSHGLSELHLVCLGTGFTLLQASGLIRLLRNGRAIAVINLVSLGLAFFILVLLSANYFTAPDLAGIKLARFIISGALAWLAGQYFRRAARHPGPGEERYLTICEAIYHFALVIAFWCFALLIPWFRQPMFTLIALGLPVLHFYRRAEMGNRKGEVQAGRYRNSAVVLAFVILGLYVFKAVFHMVLFPGTTIGTVYYHYNAPVILVLGLIMLRLHGLGGTVWLAFYGGIALMTGSYFSLTALPGLSPFDFAVHSAWSAIVLAHFWILVSYARSPLRSLIQRIAKLDDSLWHSLRHYWGVCLLVASQGATLWGLTDYQSDTYVVAPLIAAAATIFIHQGIIRLRQIGSAPPVIGTNAPATGFDYGFVYLIVAALELTLALHMDFLIPSYLRKDEVVWVILALWAVVLGMYQVSSRRSWAGTSTNESGGVLSEEGETVKTVQTALGSAHTPLKRGVNETQAAEISSFPVSSIAMYLAALAFAHIIYHHPWSAVGLWAMTAAGVLGAFNPQTARGTSSGVERFFSSLLLWIPAWLVYFSQAPIELRGLDGAFEAWPLLAATGAIFVTGLFARLFAARLALAYTSYPRSQFCLFDSTLSWLQSAGPRLSQITLWITLLAAGIVQIMHYQAQSALAPREFILLILLEAALAVSWFYEGKDRNSMVAYYLMQISAAAFFASVRRHLMLTTNFWTYEHDVWTSLACSFILAGARQALDLQARSLRVPLLATMFILPILALVWVVVHGLGINFALLVVGLHSVLFAYLGKGERESPYNIIALSGFVAFIIMTFYSKLHLKAVHAYIIPVGLGILVLQELFRARIKPDARNWIRLICLMAMLASSGYYALVDPRHAITFNLTMILLCLLAMGLGSFMQIRLYLALGFAGLMVDLISILYKVLVQMERSARMTIVGSFVLVIGALLVLGAIYYKTKKAVVDAWVQKWREKMGGWE